MKRIVLWFLSTLTAVVLLFGYHTSTAGPASTSVVAPPVAGSSGTASGSNATSSSAKTFTGPSTDTRWGPVQVAISVTDGKITDVTVPVYPDGNPKDQEINAYALPILTKSTLESQDGNVDMISGATVTSQGYATSLQGALDEAGL
ncbi:MAG: hypothetical protein QOH68_1520 [Nocardioidaceae bacterium]|nr:hypothetical protein [Nocardioidaceae bacterium]